MWTPVPMLRVELLALDRDFSALTERLGRLGVLHLLPVAQLGDWTDNLDWPEAAALTADYDSLVRRLDGVLAGLGLPRPEQGADVPIAPADVLAGASARLVEIEPPVERLLQRERSLDDEQAQLDLIAAQLELLRPLGVSMADLGRLTFLYMAAGLVPQENMARLEESLQPIPHALVPVRRVDGRVLLFAFARRDDAEVLERALRGAFVEKVAVPATFTGTPEEALAEVTARRRQLAEQRATLAAERAALRTRYGAALEQLCWEVALNREAVAAWRQAGRTERTRLLAGWVPRDRWPALARAVGDATAGRAVLQEVAPRPPGAQAGEGAANGQAAPTPPTALRNPPPFRAFESLVRTFGMPDYWALDPTPLAAVLFVLMFGAMFGDLGQGAVLAMAGFLIATGRLGHGQRDFGVILGGCGLSAMVFGLLYGSVFADEHFLPALWLRPIEHIQFFIQLAIGFGALAVSLGLILGILTAWRRRDLSAFSFGPNGLAGLWLYWGLIALLVLALAGVETPQWGVSTLLLAFLLVGVPLLLIYLHAPLSRALGWGEHTALEPTYYVEAGVESFDLVIRQISNTISFLRIAAFALSHAGLGITVVTLATMLQGVPGAPPLVLILGNALIVLLEGLIVGIQALRLQYYEFFTKFLAGRGVPYQPFTLAGRRQERA